MRYVPNPRFAAEFIKSREAKVISKPVAEQIADRVRSIAPVDTSPTASGTVYKDSIVVVDTDDGVAVTSNDPKAHLLEWGTVHMAALAPLRRAAEQIVGTKNVRATPKGGE